MSDGDGQQGQTNKCAADADPSTGAGPLTQEGNAENDRERAELRRSYRGDGERAHGQGHGEEHKATEFKQSRADGRQAKPSGQSQPPVSSTAGTTMRTETERETAACDSQLISWA